MRWAVAEDFMQLAVMPRMILDHLPENVDKVLDTILQDQQELEHELHWCKILFQLTFVWHLWQLSILLCVCETSEYTRSSIGTVF